MACVQAEKISAHTVATALVYKKMLYLMCDW